MPVIISRVAQHVACAMPKDDVGETLDYLEEYNVSRYNIHKLWTPASKEPKRPSAIYSILQAEFTTKLPKADIETIKTLA